MGLESWLGFGGMEGFRVFFKRGGGFGYCLEVYLGVYFCGFEGGFLCGFLFEDFVSVLVRICD